MQYLIDWYLEYAELAMADWAVVPVAVATLIHLLSGFWLIVSVFARGNSDDMVHLFTPLRARLLWDPKHRVPVKFYFGSMILLAALLIVSGK